MKAELIAVNNQAELSTVTLSENLIGRWIKFAGVSEKSQSTYNTALKQMFRYFSDNQIFRPTREDLVNWVKGLKAGKRSASTINLYVTSAKLFFSWLNDEGIYPDIAVKLKSGVKVTSNHKKDALSREQSAALLKSVKGDCDIDKRDRAILALMLTAGLRTIEISRADVKDIVEMEGCHYLKVQGKGRSDKDEKILLASQVYNLIQNYLATRQNLTAESPLFVSTSNENAGARLSSKVISTRVKSYLRGIGLDNTRLTAHSLRHSAATQMILAGVDIKQVQEVLRHKDISTTMIYLHDANRLKNKSEQIIADALFL